MSYSIHLRASRCESCGREGPEPDHLPDPTYNLTPIFDLALTVEELPNPDVTEFEVVLLGKETYRPRGLRLLDGKKGRDTVNLLKGAWARMGDDDLREKFLALQPKNGWGDLPGAVKVMQVLYEAALLFPDNVWEIH